MEVEEKIDLLDSFELCDHCFGRQFARLGRGFTNYERTWIIEKTIGDSEKIDETSFKRENIPERDLDLKENCYICGGLFMDIERFVKRVYNSLERYDFSTYLVGTRVPPKVSKAEEEVWEEAGVQWVEPIKSELNRMIGKELEKKLEEERGMKTDVDFKRADINPVLDIEKDRVELQINSLLIHGFYNKLERGIPQTEWTCGNCSGKGCEECEWTGKNYPESVEEIIAEPLIGMTKGLETRFHGAGREDVDALCLGKREFVIEVIEPEIRSVDLEKLEKEVKKSGKVEVYKLEMAEKDLVEKVKKRRANKTYRAKVSTDEEVDERSLDKLEKIRGTINQKTPTRVSHRRANKTRKRKVLDIKWEKLGDTSLELEIKGEAGLYIKELISGDKNNTEPSVSDVLGVKTVCEELDVIDIEKPEGYKNIS